MGILSGHGCCTAAAAGNLLQSCPTLCDPVDSSPSGSPVPGILQARTLEWVAISLSNAWKWKGKVKSLSRVRLLATPWTAAHQAPPSMGFPRQEYWSGCRCCTVCTNLPSTWHHVRCTHCHTTQDFVTDLSGSHSYLSTRCETGNVVTSEVMPFSVDTSHRFVLIRLTASDHWQSLECESCLLEVLF